MTTFPFASPYDLAEIGFIAGSNQTLVFNIYTSASEVVDISGATATWGLAVYGQGNTVFTKGGVISGSPTNQFKVFLDGTDTASLYGKYIQQYSLVDTSGSIFRPSQGLVNVTRSLSYASAPIVDYAY